MLSLLAPGKPALDGELSDWLRAHDEVLYFSAVSVAEVQQGICKLARSGGRERADRLTAWLDAVIEGVGDRILPVDAEVGRLAGMLSDKALAVGRHPGFADVAVAATAMAHGLVLLTCNGRHFAPLGIDFVDPLKTLPPSAG
ncbi:hypothetical protein STVA_07290 [Allostella vacuolata]|nr:hypothetical protein STVA_07290 [Stella vacuolata]